MTVEIEFKDFVRRYSSFNSAEPNYLKQCNHAALLVLGKSFRKWINHQLLIDDVNKKSVEKNYKKLAKLFHPDSSLCSLPEVHWLEQQLSEGKRDGSCFKILHSSYQKLMQPAQFKEIQFSGINSKEDCKHWLEQLKAQSNNYSHRSLYSSLLDLLDESTHFFDASGAIKPNALKTLIQLVPTLIASYGAFILIEELCAIYALYYVILKGGNKLSHSNYIELKEVGQVLQRSSNVTALLTTTLLVRLIELVFWSSRQCLHLTLQIGSSLLSPLLSTPEKNADEVKLNQLCRDLVLARQHQQPGMQFDTPEMKIIAAPFEKYCELNEQQFFRSVRRGGDKIKVVNAFLFQLRVIDKLPIALAEKYLEVLSQLKIIKQNKEVYTNKTAQAVDYAEQIISVLQSPNVPHSDAEEQKSAADGSLVIRCL